MLSEKVFTRNDYLELDNSRLSAEMAVISEWVVRDDLHPDELFTIFVSPTSDDLVQAACSCPRGARDETCPHALKVIREIYFNPALRDKLHERHFQPAA